MPKRSGFSLTIKVDVEMLKKKKKPDDFNDEMFLSANIHVYFFRDPRQWSPRGETHPQGSQGGVQTPAQGYLVPCEVLRGLQDTWRSSWVAEVGRDGDTWLYCCGSGTEHCTDSVCTWDRTPLLTRLGTILLSQPCLSQQQRDPVQMLVSRSVCHLPCQDKTVKGFLKRSVKSKLWHLRAPWTATPRCSQQSYTSL